MTDQIDQITDTDVEEIDEAAAGRNKRRMFITGAGLAGAAAIVGTSGTAKAVDGGDFTGPTPTQYTNDSATATDPGTTGGEAIVGIVDNAANGSHAIRGVTNGLGHSIAGDTPAGDNTVAATWGRHAGQGAGIGGVNVAEASGLAGFARGVEGVVTGPANGSHAVFGATFGAGHSIAGDTPADAAGVDGVGPNTTAATWGRHQGIGAGIGGISTGGYGGEFIGGKAHIRLITSSDGVDLPAGPPADDDHLRGEVYADGVGDLYYNTADGSNWVALTQGGAGGTILFDNPERASDTRADSTPPNTDKTKYAAGETREVDLTLVDGFAAGSTAALINLTVVNTEGARGFATVFNGDTADADRPNTSNINWNSAIEVIANSATVRPNADGVIKIYVSEATDVIVDVQGYIA